MDKSFFDFLLEYMESKKSESNRVIEKAHVFTRLFINVVYHTISWCKLYGFFASYSHNSLRVNWEGFLWALRFLYLLTKKIFIPNL